MPTECCYEIKEPIYPGARWRKISLTGTFPLFKESVTSLNEQRDKWESKFVGYIIGNTFSPNSTIIFRNKHQALYVATKGEELYQVSNFIPSFVFTVMEDKYQKCCVADSAVVGERVQKKLSGTGHGRLS